MNEQKCANCSMRQRYDKKPGSIISKLWKWHTGWCPGWKSYLRSLSEDEREAVIKKYA